MTIVGGADATFTADGGTRHECFFDAEAAAVVLIPERAKPESDPRSTN
jgi:hypothetical protein